MKKTYKNSQIQSEQSKVTVYDWFVEKPNWYENWHGMAVQIVTLFRDFGDRENYHFVRGKGDKQNN